VGTAYAHTFFDLLMYLTTYHIYMNVQVGERVPKPFNYDRSNCSAPSIVQRRHSECNSTMSNSFVHVPLKPLPQHEDRTLNEPRSLQEQKRAWIKQMGRINNGYSRRSEILEGYRRVKSLSQG
jgi:hypothetical protein